MLVGRFDQTRGGRVNRALQPSYPTAGVSTPGSLPGPTRAVPQIKKVRGPLPARNTSAVARMSSGS